MGFIDIIIIYFACGAPFGVSYWLNNQTSPFRLRNSLFSVFLWPPYALSLLNANSIRALKNKFFGRESDSDSKYQANLADVRKRMEKHLPVSVSGQALYEFREMMERFEGLSLATRVEFDTIGTAEQDLFMISGHNQPSLGSKCLQRRNGIRLESHRDRARAEFLDSITNFLDIDYGGEIFGEQALEFVKLLNDREALASVQTAISNLPQVDTDARITPSEKVIWSLEKQSQSTNATNSSRVSILTTAANSQKKG